MKNINTLIEDMEHVIATGEGWTKEISEWVSHEVNRLLNKQFDRTPRHGELLRASNLGIACERELWYSTRRGIESDTFSPSTLNKFIFGDLTEAYILGLVKASGHSLEGLQSELDILGIKGHRDCIIDGMLVDVKSASSRSFQKFAKGQIRDNDPFGYISQLSTYLYGSQDDPLLTYKDKAAWLVFSKEEGKLALVVEDLSKELEVKEKEILKKKAIVKSETPPKRVYEPVPHGESGNMKIPVKCSYCSYKDTCWGNLEKRIYSNGPIWFTKIVKEPKLKERF